jgi:hypothetical protein
MWITAWGLLVLVPITLVLNFCFDPNEIMLALSGNGTIVYTQPAYSDYWPPIGSLFGLPVVATLVLWVLYRSSEEDYAEYMFTEYAVSIAESGRNSRSVTVQGHSRLGSHIWTTESTQRTRHRPTADDPPPAVDATDAVSLCCCNWLGLGVCLSGVVARIDLRDEPVRALFVLADEHELVNLAP